MLGQVDVPADHFQVILAYNTPEPLPIEDVLRDMAAHDSRLCLLRVADSRSKAENVNAALKVATGEIVAVYDADHLPEAALLPQGLAAAGAGVRCRAGPVRDPQLRRELADADGRRGI